MKYPKVSLFHYKKGLVLLLFLTISATAFAQYVPKDKRKKPKDSTKVKPTPKKPTETTNTNRDNDNEEMGRRWLTGGNFWLQFGNPTFIDISPTLGYWLTPSLIGGVGVGYLYSRFQLNNSFGQTLDLQNQIYSGRVYLQYIIDTKQLLGEGNRLFLYSEYEVLRSDYYDRTNELQRVAYVQRPQIGGGIQQRLGRIFVNLMVLYNLNYLEDVTPYPTPVTVRIGFNVGI
ncbi:MAG TPA: hypothetical protein DCS93_19925 [Microscillaceae bacterium]|nr:hypothetical protein [Microscillaceae bacterium]